MIIDRFEGDFAVVELDNGTMINVPKAMFPSEAAEGDVIIVTVDKDKTAQRKAKIEKKFNSLFRD